MLHIMFIKYIFNVKFLLLLERDMNAALVDVNLMGDDGHILLDGRKQFQKDTHTGFGKCVIYKNSYSRFIICSNVSLIIF